MSRKTIAGIIIGAMVALLAVIVGVGISQNNALPEASIEPKE